MDNLGAISVQASILNEYRASHKPAFGEGRPLCYILGSNPPGQKQEMQGRFL